MSSSKYREYPSSSPCYDLCGCLSVTDVKNHSSVRHPSTSPYLSVICYDLHVWLDATNRLFICHLSASPCYDLYVWMDVTNQKLSLSFFSLCLSICHLSASANLSIIFQTLPIYLTSLRLCLSIWHLSDSAYQSVIAQTLPICLSSFSLSLLWPVQLAGCCKPKALSVILQPFPIYLSSLSLSLLWPTRLAGRYRPVLYLSSFSRRPH